MNAELLRVDGLVKDFPIQPAIGLRVPHRCRRAENLCATTPPPMREVGPGHLSACNVTA